jgi:hypothetical protein
MNIALKIRSQEMGSEDLQSVAQDLCHAFNQESIRATIPDAIGSPGQKGDPVTVGTIILALISSGGVVVTVANVIKSFIEKPRGLEFEIESGGRKIVVKASDIRSQDSERLIGLLDGFLKNLDSSKQQ